MMQSSEKVAASVLDAEKSFDECNFGLDRRLSKAAGKLKFQYATLVQIHCIPLALAGKDLLVRARTGSGKTAAYALPMLQKILEKKAMDSNASSSTRSSIKAVVLVPTRELVEQVRRNIAELMIYCSNVITILGLGGESMNAQQALLRDVPDILVATPGRLVSHLNAGNVDFSTHTVETLIIDEADLVLSFGYEKDVRMIYGQLSRKCQTLLMSATLSPELDQLKRAMLQNPAIVKLEEGESNQQLQQFYVPVKKSDKDLLLYALLKLGLIQGKVLFFTNSTESAYRLKLFFEQFSIKAAVLNAELPFNSRQHTILEFNKGIFDYLIATDESVEKDQLEDDDEEDEPEMEAIHESSEEEEEDEEDDDEDLSSGTSDDEDGPATKTKSKSKPLKKDQMFGVARGVDFKDVAFVVNVDFPKSVKSYIHRIGRTARGGATGTAISLVDDQAADGEELAQLHKVQNAQAPIINYNQNPEAALQANDGELENQVEISQPAPLAFEMEEINCFRYRVEDVRRAVTNIGVREARLQDIKNEMLNSDKLKSHFEDNPRDLNILNHDKTIGKARIQPHLATIPSYLVPEAFQVPKAKKNKRHRKSRPTNGDKRRRTDNDPLHNFEAPEPDQAQDDGGDRIVGAGDDIGHSTAGRQKWKARHKKGQFNLRGVARRARIKDKGFSH